MNLLTSVDIARGGACRKEAQRNEFSDNGEFLFKVRTFTIDELDTQKTLWGSGVGNVMQRIFIILQVDSVLVGARTVWYVF